MGDTLTIRDVPIEAHDELVSRAALAGQSLQDYLLQHLAERTRKPDMKTLMAWVREWKARAEVNVSVETILADLDAERA